MLLSGWGRFPRVECRLRGMREPEDARAAVAAEASLIARGNGRSYGDAALNPACTLSTLPSGRILAFDPQSGRITCEAGLLLADLLAFAVPRGFFPPVTPGTKFVTIGGMIAADVHGKNHHAAGTFGAHVESLSLLTADGEILRCACDENAELFAACRGGMGLLGIILDATFRLIAIETPMIRQETRRAADLTEAMALLEDTAAWTYSVAWIDCLAPTGRSLVYLGEHAPRAQVAEALAVPSRKSRGVPVDLPRLALGRYSVRVFNELYYRRGQPGTALIDYDRYFYPLDALLDWNRIYGRQGFVQYQCVIPLAACPEGMAVLLRRIAAAGCGSFLAVLKLFGAEGDGLLSFPTEGYTLALDFPASIPVFNLLIELDAIVTDFGGRLYLAKDARSGAAMMRTGYPRLAHFRRIRAAVDPAGKFASVQSQRLDL
jgi:decaprenylphospho-beta-D-ribofuranose 2-oxidase